MACPLVPWRLPPLQPSRGSRGIGKPRTHCAARMRTRGCLKIDKVFRADAPRRVGKAGGRECVRWRAHHTAAHPAKIKMVGTARKARLCPPYDLWSYNSRAFEN